MKRHGRPLRWGILLVAGAFALGACASPGENTTGRTVGTAIGALAGGVIGYQKDKKTGALKGALIGGAAGYAVGWLVDGYVMKRTKTAAQVQAEYKVPVASPVPPSVHAYGVVIHPDKTLLRGKGAEATTEFDLVAASGAKPSVEESRAIVAPDGKTINKKRYSYKEVDGPGGYEFRQKLPVPAEADQGIYRYDSVLYVNGKEASRASNEFQVARSSAGGIAVAWLGPRMSGRRIR
ncbi:MAG: YMGG-like glycine zipper-containing protein [Desulfobacteria bacterium]